VGDRLPNQTPEYEVFTVDSIFDVTGSIDDKTSMAWVIASPGSIPEGILDEYQVISDVQFKDSLITNGGKISENKNFAFDSQNQESGLFNIESEKVLTYASIEGAHMVGEEEYTLSIAGNYDALEDDIRCVFAEDSTVDLPAFCNIVSAKSSLLNVNSAQVSTKGQIRAVGETADIPAELNYRIAVTPDANSGSGFAEGTVITTFAGSIMEARDIDNYEDSANWNKTSAENTWKDHSEVTGGIRNFQKALEYQSGLVI
jgi:hypothetical protein